MVGGKSVTIAIQDKCEACVDNDIDMSPAAFARLAAKSDGR